MTHAPDATGDPTVDALAHDPRVGAFERFFVPDGARLAVQLECDRADRAEDDGSSSGWKQVRRVDTRHAVIAHLLAGGLDEPQPIATRDGRDMLGPVNAIGVALPDGAHVPYLNVDLDGGYPPHAVVALLRAWFRPDSVMVTSSSGRAGRYRALVRLNRTVPHEDAKRMFGAMADAYGCPLMSGALELYPAKGNGRLPFGRGGCARYTDVALTECVRENPFALFDRLRNMPAVDLETAYVRALEAAGHAPFLARAEVRAEAVAQRFERSAPRVRAATEAVVRARVGHSAEALYRARLWRDGVSGPGERDRAILALALDCRNRRMPVNLAVADVCAWVRGGGLARSPTARKRGMAWTLKDTERRVREIYKRPHTELAARPIPLTEGELRAATELAEQCATASALPVASVASFLLRALPTMKWGAYAITPDTPDGVLVSRGQWVEWGGPEYAVLRDATGLFTRTEAHRSAEYFGSRARTARWRCSFAYDTTTPPPRRMLVPTRGRKPRDIYARAVAVLAECERKAARRRTKPRVPGHTQTPPGPGSGLRGSED